MGWIPSRRLIRISSDRHRGTRRRDVIAGWLPAAASYCHRHPRAVRLLFLLFGMLAGGLASGPIAAIVAGTYLTVAAFLCHSWQNQQRTRRERVAIAEGIGMTAAELRAGNNLAGLSNASGFAWLKIDAATSRTEDDAERQDILSRLDAAFRVSGQLGIPLADLLDKIESDCRCVNQLQRSIAAQTAGNQATALLLALLPFAGLAGGIGMGIDPLTQLLHTALGAACTLCALIMQVVGLLWVMWLRRRAVEVL